MSELFRRDILYAGLLNARLCLKPLLLLMHRMELSSSQGFWFNPWVLPMISVSLTRLLLFMKDEAVVNLIGRTHCYVLRTWTSITLFGKYVLLMKLWIKLCMRKLALTRVVLFC